MPPEKIDCKLVKKILNEAATTAYPEKTNQDEKTTKKLVSRNKVHCNNYFKNVELVEELV